MCCIWHNFYFFSARVFGSGGAQPGGGMPRYKYLILSYLIPGESETQAHCHYIWRHSRRWWHGGPPCIWGSGQ